MKKLIVKIKEEKKICPVIIGGNLIGTIDSLFSFGKYSKIAIITGENIPEKWVNLLRESLNCDSSLIVIPGNEKSKNINTVIYIWSQLKKLGLDRKSLVINLGGGVICDLGGFAASTYLRGIDFLQIPTTVLAQVDASVGGKLGFNFENVKNYIGVFQQPIGVVVDVDVLSTLPRRIYDQGFGEIIKHGLVADRAYFEFVTSKAPAEFNASELTQILSKSNEIKVDIVSKDHKENGIRKLINFGHTIGHAIESLSLDTDDPFLHGEAVHLGLVVETKISELMGLLTKEDAEIVYDKLSHTGLPIYVSNISAQDIMEKLGLDKKVVKGKVNWTLLEGIGHAVYDKKVDNSVVEQALKTILK
jgi:3-dehydroquinate synthase